MKSKRTVGTTRTRKSAATAALVEAREQVKAAKKRVKEAKAALKSARTDLKAAKRARKEAQSRREAEIAKRANVRRRSPAAATPAAATKGAPRLKRITVRKVQTAAAAGLDAPDSAIPAPVESGQALAH